MKSAYFYQSINKTWKGIPETWGGKYSFMEYI